MLWSFGRSTKPCTIRQFSKVVLFTAGRPRTPAKMMMQCFHFMVEPAKTLTAKIKVSSLGAQLYVFDYF